MEKDVNRKLLEGFAKILYKKHSVTLLCEKAEVSRATFYLHYNDLEDFTQKTRAYIINKYFQQLCEILFCEKDKLSKVIKKENLILDETEIKLLAYFAEGNNYIPFMLMAHEKILPSFQQLCKEKFGEDFCRENEYRLKYGINGITTLMFFNLVNYDEKKFLFEMKQSREIVGSVLNREYE